MDPKGVEFMAKKIVHWEVIGSDAKKLQDFYGALLQEIIPSRIEPGKPWQNGSNESFNGTFRRACLDAELFQSLAEARVVIEDWRHLYNHERPHSALGYQVPAAVFE